MARPQVRLDLKGLEEAASSALVKWAVGVKADEIARNVRSQGITVEGDGTPLPVTVHKGDQTRDMRVNRARVAVTLAHPAGQAVQAKHGALTKAAAQAGLEVKS